MIYHINIWNHNESEINNFIIAINFSLLMGAKIDAHNNNESEIVSR